MSKLLATSTDPYGKASDDKKVPEGNGIWSELLNNVSSGLPSSDANASFSHASNQNEDMSNGDVSLMNGDHTATDDSIATGGGGSAAKLKSKHILVIGDTESGKTTLLSALKGVSPTSTADKTASGKGSKLIKSGYALDYYYLDVESEELDMEESRKCSVWVLRGHSGVQSLLQSSYSAQMVPQTLFTIVLDFSQPWRLKQSLENALQHIQSIISKLEVAGDVITTMKKKLERRFQVYCDNEVDAKQKSNTSADELLPLGDGVLTENLGVPLMIVCTKLDSLVDLEKSYKYNDEHFDYIQQFLRTECLKHGASLAYTSSKDSRYLAGIYKLILNSLYEVLPKTGTLASVVEKDSIYVPIGWDNLLKIKTVQDNLIGEIKVDDVFEDVCKQPAQIVSKRGQHPEVSGTPLMADEEQMFLNRSQSALQKPVQTGTSSIMSPMRGGGSSGSRPPISATANGGEANLQQFFNSLLNSKSRGGGSTSGMSSPGRNSSAMSTPDQRRMTAPPKAILQQQSGASTPVMANPAATAVTPGPPTNGASETA